MGKKRSAVRRAAATAAASAAPTSPAHPLDTTAAPVNTTPTCDARELAKCQQQPRVSHEADAPRATRAASPAQPTVDTTLIHEPAIIDTRATESVAIATPQPHVKRDVPASALHAPFPALSALAAADLATAVARIGPPNLYIACPVHDLDRLDARDPELDALAPRTRPAMSIGEIDEDLLKNIIEDAQSLTRIEIRREVRLKALEEGRERGWTEGLEEGMRLARIEARVEVRQKEMAWRDGYEQGRWEGYREGLDVARTEVSTSPRFDTSVQTDDAPRTTSPIDTSTTASHVDASAQSDDPPRPIPTDAVPASSHVNVAAQTDGVTPTHATEHTDAGVQAEGPLPQPSPPDDTHSPYPRVEACVQTDTPRASAPARARTPHEIEPDLLREIIATASAKGEAKGFTKGKHIGFQDGMEAGWKSGTREGHSEGKKAGIEEGREQARAEVSSTSRAIAVVQTDDVEWPTRVDRASQTLPAATLRAPSTHDTNLSRISPVSDTFHSYKLPTNSNTSIPYNDLSLSHNDTNASSTTAHTHFPSFSWADEPSLLPISSTTPLISPPPRDFSILRSSTARPFDSLKRRARRSQARPPRPSCPLRSSIPISEPIITRRHPTGLRADRPSVIVSSSLSVPPLVKLEAPPLDWQGDPRLQELGRVLRGLGWVRG